MVDFHCVGAGNINVERVDIDNYRLGSSFRIRTANSYALCANCSVKVIVDVNAVGRVSGSNCYSCLVVESVNVSNFAVRIDNEVYAVRVTHNREGLREVSFFVREDVSNRRRCNNASICAVLLNHRAIFSGNQSNRCVALNAADVDNISRRSFFAGFFVNRRSERDSKGFISRINFDVAFRRRRANELSSRSNNRTIDEFEFNSVFNGCAFTLVNREVSIFFRLNNNQRKVVAVGNYRAGEVATEGYAVAVQGNRIGNRAAIGRVRNFRRENIFYYVVFRNEFGLVSVDVGGIHSIAGNYNLRRVGIFENLNRAPGAGEVVSNIVSAIRFAEERDSLNSLFFFARGNGSEQTESSLVIDASFFSIAFNREGFVIANASNACKYAAFGNGYDNRAVNFRFIALGNFDTGSVSVSQNDITGRAGFARREFNRAGIERRGRYNRRIIISRGSGNLNNERGVFSRVYIVIDSISRAAFVAGFNRGRKVNALQRDILSANSNRFNAGSVIIFHVKREGVAFCCVDNSCILRVEVVAVNVDASLRVGAGSFVNSQIEFAFAVNLQEVSQFNIANCERAFLAVVIGNETSFNNFFVSGFSCVSITFAAFAAFTRLAAFAAFSTFSTFASCRAGAAGVEETSVSLVVRAIRSIVASKTSNGEAFGVGFDRVNAVDRNERSALSSDIHCAAVCSDSCAAGQCNFSRNVSCAVRINRNSAVLQRYIAVSSRNVDNDAFSLFAFFNFFRNRYKGRAVNRVGRNIRSVNRNCRQLYFDSVGEAVGFRINVKDKIFSVEIAGVNRLSVSFERTRRERVANIALLVGVLIQNCDNLLGIVSRAGAVNNLVKAFAFGQVNRIGYARYERGRRRLIKGKEVGIGANVKRFAVKINIRSR